MTQRHAVDGLAGVYLYTTQEASPTVGLVYELECDRLNRVRFTLDFEVNIPTPTLKGLVSPTSYTQRARMTLGLFKGLVYRCDSS